MLISCDPTDMNAKIVLAVNRPANKCWVGRWADINEGPLAFARPAFSFPVIPGWNGPLGLFP